MVQITKIFWINNLKLTKWNWIRCSYEEAFPDEAQDKITDEYTLMFILNALVPIGRI